MTKKKNLLKTLLCLLLCVTLLPVVAFADSDTPKSFSDETANEMLFDPNPNQAPQLLTSTAPLTKKTLSCAGFISTKNQQIYIDRMIQWYLAEYAELRETLANGFSVVMFFEGGSDNTQNKLYADPDYRDGALGLVLRQENGQTYIADYCENCTTLPDYPMDDRYDNGHPGYGTATLMDGVYNISNVNHRGYYFALNATKAGCSNIPCIYMCNDGTFAQLNGTGINVHTRMRNYVSDDPLSPVSAGCITIGDNSLLREFNSFMSAYNNGYFPTTSTYFNQAATYKYDDTVANFQSFGKIVVDRYLAREKMLEIYGNNQEAVDAITRHSVLAQQDPYHVLSGFTEYPSYQQLTLWVPTAVKTLPTVYAPAVSTVLKTVKATALYAKGADLWYQVQTDSGIGFLPASAVASVTALYDDISIHGENYPEVKEEGAAFSVSGILGSVYNCFTSVTGSIFSETGTTECSYTAGSEGPMNTHSYSIAPRTSDYGYTDEMPYNMDDAMTFSSLAAGEHRYQVKATVRNYYAKFGQVRFEEKTLTFVDQPFTVESSVEPEPAPTRSLLRTVLYFLHQIRLILQHLPLWTIGR